MSDPTPEANQPPKIRIVVVLDTKTGRVDIQAPIQFQAAVVSALAAAIQVVAMQRTNAVQKPSNGTEILTIHP